MTSVDQNHDDLLFEVLKDCKTLPNFLDEIFGFLQRRYNYFRFIYYTTLDVLKNYRTDFYHIAKDATAGVGLPEGLGEKLLRYTFCKWKPAPLDKVYKENEIPAVVEEIVACSEQVIEESSSESQLLNADSVDPDQGETFSKSDSYNGATFESYCWSQTISDLDIVIKIPENVSKKDIKVKILPNKISVKLKDKFILEGELYKKCRASEAMWSLDKCKLNIHLDKCQEMWWSCLVRSEPELDISKIDCSRPYEELPEEAQAKIEELQWNQERKRLGLPTSDEIAMQDMLKKAWNAEGSPFSGPFAPDTVQF